MISFISLLFVALVFSALFTMFTKKNEIQCGVGLTLCGGECVNTENDNNNCGSCGNVCITSSSCSNSSCVCDEGLTLCGNICASLQAIDLLCCDGVVTITSNNDNHCGSCDNPCDTQNGFSCQASVCQGG